MTTFKDLAIEQNVDLVIRKAGLSLAIIFPKDFLIRFNLKYGDTIRLNLAEIVKKESKQ